ncbi:hypothetical protein [Pedobacter sp.]|jgi:hypothetical protein|uniref:hypothetical protein n=1 Tax=Pedobacter sp. TaxID=1411316 RepID=UPI002C1AFD9B|nr:hypothetical protein [Pedobacter sp.]HWW41779.1 hypothetical protein [Pedobacter sp.]
MRIVFVCGGLEPGKDGVGDYVRKLSKELIKNGHQIWALALNDPFIRYTFQSLIPLGNGEPLELRLPADLSAKEKVTKASSFIRAIDPDFMSLQFVPFSFHPKGLPYQLSGILKQLGTDLKWHIMFHELWIGMDRQSPVKHQLLGMAQRRLIKGLLRKLKPVLVHTHCSVYLCELKKLTDTVQKLPLFSNIPVVDPYRISQKMKQDYTLADELSIVLFGGIHSGAPIKAFAAEAADYAKRNHKNLKLIVAGRNGPEQRNVVKDWEQAGLPVTISGELDNTQLSKLLTELWFGLFTTPILLAEKSGAVAAMTAHGIHLICVAREWQPFGPVHQPNPLHKPVYERGKLARFFQVQPDFSGNASVRSVSEQFIANLSNAKSYG